jgi:hypothetical protein
LTQVLNRVMTAGRCNSMEHWPCRRAFDSHIVGRR